jgi:DNA-binding transcriptional MerR regulator
METLFTAGNIKELAGLPQQTLNDWVSRGIVKPAQQAKGKGHHRGTFRGFTMMQVIGIMVGRAQQQTEYGCVLSYVKAIVDAFSETTEAELLKQFAKGNTRLAMVLHGKPRLDGETRWGWVNVEAIYKKVKKYAERMAKRKPVPGRAKGIGLVGANN